MSRAEVNSGSRLPNSQGPNKGPLPHAEFQKTPEKPSPPIIFVATRSQRKLDFIKYISPPGSVVEALKPGGEDNSQEYGIPIVVKKNDDAIRQIPPDNNRRSKILVIAGDVRSRTFGIEDGVCITKARGKPSKIGHIRDAFADMANASRRAGINPYYSLDIATEIVTLNANGVVVKRLPKDHTTYIELDPEKIAYFTTPRGFEKYCREAQLFFNSPFHLPNGDPSITNVAAGLDLALLLRLGAVKKLCRKVEGKKDYEEISREDEGFEKAAKGGLFDAYMSYIPIALKSHFPEIGQAIDKYPPIQRLTSYALRQD